MTNASTNASADDSWPLPIWGYTWYVIYFPIYTPNVLLTVASLVYLVAESDCYPVTLRIWLIPKAVSDILAVTVNGMRLILALSMPSIRIIFHGVTECRLLMILRYFIEIVSTFLLAGMCIERALSIAFPLRRRSLITVKRTVIAVTFVVSYSLSVSVIFSVLGITGFDPHHRPHLSGCLTNVKVTTILSSYDLYAHRVLPMAVFVVTSVVLVHCVVASSRHRLKMTSTEPSDAPGTLTAKERRLCVTLVLLNVAFFVCAVPYTGWTMAVEMNRKKGVRHNGVDLVTFIMVNNILMLNDYIDNAVNWVFYCGVNAHFREWLGKKLNCCGLRL